MECKGKVAVVTGAGRGIGKAVAMELARRGVGTIALVDLSDDVHAVARGIEEFTEGRVHADPFVGNVTDPEFRHGVYEHVASEHGVPRICVPAAGITRDSLATKINKETGKAVLYSVDDFRLVLEVNLVAPVYWALEMVGFIAEDRHVRGLKHWQPEEHIQGTVIFIGSVSSQGNKGQISYAATKAGLEGVAATLTKEAIFHGVRCGVIHPGFTDTPMVRGLGDDYIQKHILPFTQLRRLITTEEIADAICFMIGNSAITGEMWADAGWHPSA